MTRREGARRIRLLGALAVVGVALMILRAGWLGTVDASWLSAVAAGQQQRTIVSSGQRGAIVDRNGYELAFDRLSDTVVATPYLITNPQQVATRLAPLLKMPEGAILAKLIVSGGYSVVDEGLNQSVGNAVQQLGISGISVQDSFARDLPNNNLAAQVLGLVGQNGGISGLEERYNTALKGTPGVVVENQDPQGQALSTVKSTPPKPGKTVQLTIDSDIQSNLESILASTQAQFRAKSVSGIVMQPQTGAILAMASAPGYNPNDRTTFHPAAARLRSVTDQFEPGSIFKIVTMAGAIQDGLVTPSTRIVVPGVLSLYDRKIHDAESHGTADWSVSEILERSSNIGTIEVAQRLGYPSLASWISKFGFGRPTGIDFPGESTGFFPQYGGLGWSGVSIGNVPIGQGVSATQVQIARAYAVIANRGRLVTPHLVAKIGGKPVQYPAGPRVVSTGTALAVDGMLRKVVSAQGTGDAATVKGYSVAGKTGTAQVVGSNGQYSNSLFMSSFAGYVPANHPQLVIVVTVDEPGVGTYGGTVAAPAFSQIASMALIRLGIPPG
jgi:cell division protein FtsI (penicillin-binding protein 3)/stage V sporulation protein D (sporulation-specific penicillin-binding protein)